MRALWHAVHDDLTRIVSSHNTHNDFIELRSRHPALESFADPVSLIDHMHGREGCSRSKNRILHALVLAAQCSSSDAATAGALITLALWPGLDAIHRRKLRDFREEPGALASDLTFRLLHGIHRLDLDRVTWIAATLLRNIERDIGRQLQAARCEADQRASPEVLDALAAEDPRRIDRCLVEQIGHLLGEDARLVLDVAVRGLSQREAAIAHGLTCEAARKRYQRARALLRGALVT